MDVECRIIFNSGREPEYRTVNIEYFTCQEDVYDYLAQRTKHRSEMCDVQFVTFFGFLDIVEEMCNEHYIPNAVFEFVRLDSEERSVVIAYWANICKSTTIERILESYVCNMCDWKYYEKFSGYQVEDFFFCDNYIFSKY